jgi:hypothetical protein
MAFDPLSAGFEFAGKVIDKIFPNPEQAAEAKLRLAELNANGELAKLTAETELAKGQQSINLEEAKNANIFVSGWRPFIGWVCGCAFAYHFVLQPLLAFLFALGGHDVKLPAFDMNALFTVLMGLLGLGGYRTYEKIKGVQ